MESAGQRKWVAEALIGLVCLMLLSQIGRLAYLNTLGRPKLDEQIHKQLIGKVIIPGRRGSIFDRAHRVLAGSKDMPTVFVDPVLIKNLDEACRELGDVLGLSPDAIREWIATRLEKNPESRYIVISRAVEDEIADEVTKLALDGVAVHPDAVRDYPMGSRAAHILGFVSSDGSGLEGVECTFEGYLKATHGERTVIRDIRRRALFQAAESYVPAQDGCHVILTIDAAIQETVEREIARQVEHHAAESAVGLVMNPQTGEILALANYPTYEPIKGTGAPKDHLRNRCLTDPVEPGSIFKPYTMARALADGVTHPEEVIDCSGLPPGNKRRLHDHHAMGHLTVIKILTRSSNIGMARLGLRLGNPRLYDTLKAFGFCARTAIDLPGEDPGLVPPLKRWNSYSTTSVPMGQEVAVTPIQIVTAFSSIVNGGRLLKPRVIQAVIDPKNTVVKDNREVVDRGQSVDPKTAATMKDILAEVVRSGTGKRCDLDRWQVMGKTGTAEVPWPAGSGKKGYEPGAYLASFIAAAPMEEPAVAVLVMVRKPKKNGYYGSQAALPAVRVILEETLRYLDVPPDKPLDGSVTMAGDRTRH
jgi:cell division protein FtsI (penicillin-binding protein 3)